MDVKLVNVGLCNSTQHNNPVQEAKKNNFFFLNSNKHDPPSKKCTSHPSNPLRYRRLLRNHKRLRLSSVTNVGSAAELHRRASPFFTARVLCLYVGSCSECGRVTVMRDGCWVPTFLAIGTWGLDSVSIRSRFGLDSA